MKELLWSFTNFSPLLFWSNQSGNLPAKLFWDRSTANKLYWWKRNVGIPLSSLFKLQLDSTRTFNWNIGFQPGFSVSISNLLLSLINRTNSSLTWLENELNKNKPSKRLLLRSMYWRDVRLGTKDEGTLPVKLFWERSNSLRDNKLLRHRGRFPSKLFSLRSNS